MNNLILGNCLEKEIPKCRLLLTDIPYEEVNRKSNGKKFKKYKFFIYFKGRIPPI